MNRLLARQLRLVYGKGYDFDDLTQLEKSLVDTVSKTYDEHDKERRFYEHVLNTTSEELNEKNRTISHTLTTLSNAQRLTKTGSWTYTIQDKTIEWSDELFRIFNLKPQQFEPFLNFCSQVVHPDDHLLVDMDFQKTLSDGFYDQVYRLKLNDGMVKYVHDYREVVENEMGIPVLIRGTLQDVTERKADQDRIQYLAHHDSLTGVINRFSLEERLEQAIQEAKRHEEQLAILFIDMDRFKTINDTYGHQVGDNLLKQVANRLKDHVSSNDIVARIGGDEFVIVLSNLDSALSADPIARKLVKRLGDTYPIMGNLVISSPSIGISVFPSDAQNSTELLQKADTAMYHAKQLGRNNYQFFSESLNSEANEYLMLENELRKALENQDFELYYQPKISVKTNRPMGVEALLRWNHHEMGFVSPEKFVNVAEHSGLIIPLGNWVLEEACRQKQLWKKKFEQPFKMSVNVSAQQLESEDFVAFVEEMVKKYDVSSGQLELEVTETTAMVNPEKSIKRLNQIAQLNVDIAMDDFGTGYSSLSYLKVLPIQTLKLDRTFVQDLENDPDNAIICAASISLAQKLGLQVVAEGVETEQQKEFLVENGCDLLQGYYFSRPVPAADLEVFMQPFMKFN